MDPSAIPKQDKQKTPEKIGVRLTNVDVVQCGQFNTIVYVTSPDKDEDSIDGDRQHGGCSEVQIVNEYNVLKRYTIDGATVISIGSNCSLVEIKLNKEIEKHLKEMGEFIVTRGDKLVSVLWKNEMWYNDSITITELKINFLKDGQKFNTKELEKKIFDIIREENNGRLCELINELITTFNAKLRHIEIGCLQLVVSSETKDHARSLETKQEELKDLLRRTIFPKSVDMDICFRNKEEDKSTFESPSEGPLIEDPQKGEPPDLVEWENPRMQPIPEKERTVSISMGEGSRPTEEEDPLADQNIRDRSYGTKVVDKLPIDRRYKMFKPEPPVSECVVVIVGKTGSGKSSLGNSLFADHGIKPFIARMTATSCTKKCQRVSGTIADGTRLTIVDTPGLFDTYSPNEKTSKEIVRSISLCAPGPHVILYVLSLMRFTEEEVDTVNILKKMFGTAEAMKHIIVVFTRKDALDDAEGDDVKTIDDYVNHGPEYLKDFLKECNMRYVGIANKQHSPTHNSDVQDVMKLIYKTMEQNGNQVYSQEAFAKADQVLKREIERRKPTSTKTENEISEEIMEDIQSNNVEIWKTLDRELTNVVSDALSFYGRGSQPFSSFYDNT